MQVPSLQSLAKVAEIAINAHSPSWIEQQKRNSLDRLPLPAPFPIDIFSGVTSNANGADDRKSPAEPCRGIFQQVAEELHNLQAGCRQRRLYYTNMRPSAFFSSLPKVKTT